MSPLKRLKYLLLPEKKDLWVIVIYGICSGLFGLIVPIAVQTLVNTIAFGSLLQPIFVLTFLVLFILGISCFIRGMQVYLMEIVQQRIFARTSLILSERIPTFEIEAFEENRGTELINRFFDVLTVQKSTALIVMDGLSLLLQTLVGMMLLAFYHPILLAFDMFLVALICIVLFLLGRGAISSSIFESQKKYQVAGWLEELARIPLVFKHPKSSRLVNKYSDELTMGYLKGRKAHFKILMHQIIGALSLQVLASSMLLGLGGWLVIKRQLTLGQLVAAELVVSSVVNSIGKFGKYLESYYDLAAAADKIGYLLDIPTEKRDPIQISDPILTPHSKILTVENLHYSYPGRDLLLSGIHLSVSRGEKVAILGKRGEGKSTFCELVYGLRVPSKGSIEYCGIQIQDLPRSLLRSNLSLLRRIELFDGTILDNLKIHSTDKGLGEVYQALEVLGILKEIKELPKGLNTLITGEKSPLSAAQAKLVVLARALLAQPELLILDGFLDDLDDQSREIVLQTLLPRKDLTMVLTTGSRSITQGFEKLLILDSGKLTLEERMKL